MNSFSIVERAQVRFHAKVLKQHLLERALFLRGLLAQLPHQGVRLRAAHFLGERERHRLRHDLPAGQFEIGAQALDVDLETLRNLGHGAERARGDQRKRRKCHPFGVPAAERSLVLLDLGGEAASRPGSARRSRLTARLRFRRDCACAGMVEEPPRPGAPGSNASPTSVCIISVTSRAILPQVPARMPKQAATSARRSRWLCHGASGSGRSSRR